MLLLLLRYQVVDDYNFFMDGYIFFLWIMTYLRATLRKVVLRIEVAPASWTKMAAPVLF